jgi:predicted ABC-type ATPase
LKHKNLFIIAGCNGAGKTTASYSILPDILDCKEFVNADEIAKGLSPFQPEKVSFESGRIMLHRIDELLEKENSFAFETTLSAKSYVSIIQRAQNLGYIVTLVFFWLNSVELAKQRVLLRVNEGGHNIPKETIERRYNRGLKNLFEIYLDICDAILVFDNSNKNPNIIFKKEKTELLEILNNEKYSLMLNSYER